MSGHWLRNTFFAPRQNSLAQSSTTDAYVATQFSYLASYAINLNNCDMLFNCQKVKYYATIN